VCTGGNDDGTSRLGTTFLKFQSVRCQVKDILPFIIFFPSRHPHALWTNIRSRFGRTLYTPKLLIEAEDATLLQTKHMIKQNGL